MYLKIFDRKLNQISKLRVGKYSTLNYPHLTEKKSLTLPIAKSGISSAIC